MSSIKANLDALNRRIGQAAQRSGRKADEITLVAVTKTHPIETVVEGYGAGLRHFGENRSDEGLDKVVALREWLEANPNNKPPHWHFIGHLQSRQVGAVLTGQYSLVHSVDSLKLAQRIDRLARRDNHPPVNVLLQCNVSGEESKFGFDLNHWPTGQEKLAAFVKTAGQIAKFEKIVIQGLMTIAPICDNPEEVRPVFKSLAKLSQRLQQELPQINWHHLSMGMTDDFEVAIEEGATIIRVGRAIFGARRA